MAPYGRLLNSNEPDQGERGTSGFLGPRTELFALGSLYYLINYGFGAYGDRCLTEDPYEHGPRVVELLQRMEFPELNGDPLIDAIIDKCWHYKYATVSELAAHKKELLNEGTKAVESNEKRKERSQVTSFVTAMFNGRYRMFMDRILDGICYGLGVWWRSFSLDFHSEAAITDRDDIDENWFEDRFSSKREFCQDLEERGLLRLLSSGEPKEIGFTLEWYRHSLSS